MGVTREERKERVRGEGREDSEERRNNEEIRTRGKRLTDFHRLLLHLFCACLSIFIFMFISAFISLYSSPSLFFFVCLSTSLFSLAFLSSSTRR
jgi:hypothetical protein